MNLLICIAISTFLFTAQHADMHKGMSHAMGFDQEATTHHFKLSETGGSIEVTVKKREDAETLTAVRNHLRMIANEFAQGNFAKPLAVHGEVPPGTAVMQENATAISYQYEELPDGGLVRIKTTDGTALKAVHEFLRYQIKEHKTGDPVRLR